MKLSLLSICIVFAVTTACHTTKATEVSSTTPVSSSPEEQTEQIKVKNIDPNDPLNMKMDETTLDCFDKTYAQPDIICDEDNRPVCGCNNVNYKNACEANKVGIRHYSWGKCPKSIKIGSK
jgi:hypothetical protein